MAGTEEGASPHDREVKQHRNCHTENAADVVNDLESKKKSDIRDQRCRYCVIGVSFAIATHSGSERGGGGEREKTDR